MLLDLSDYLGVTFLDAAQMNALLAVLAAVLLSAVLYGVKRLVMRRARRFVELTDNQWDDMLLVLVERTHTWFLAAVSLYPTLYLVTLPPKVESGLTLFITMLVWIQAGLWGHEAITFWQGVLRERERRGELASTVVVTILGVVGRVIVWSGVTLLILQSFGFDISTLLAGLGVGGVAIALAVQNVLGDLLASLSIALDKPFVVGDVIAVDALTGTVEHIGLKTTRVRSLSGEMLIFSNGDLLKSRIRNFRQLKERRVTFTLGVTYDTPADVLESIPNLLRTLIEKNEKVRFDRAHVKAFGDSAILVEAVYVVLESDYLLYMDIQQSINLAIYRAFAEAHIEFAYPTQTVHLAPAPRA